MDFTALTDLLQKNWAAWVANPIPAIVAAMIALIVGYWQGRHRYLSKIDGMESRIEALNERIRMKDEAIASISVKREAATDPGRKVIEVQVGRDVQPSGARKREELEEVLRLPRVESRQPMTERDQQFATANARILSALDERIRKLILNNRFELTFNPDTERSKAITFREDGSVGEGRNSNEDRWRIENGRLEIIQSDGAVHSRFVLLSDGSSFHHTNEPDTKSIKGQFIRKT